MLNVIYGDPFLSFKEAFCFVSELNTPLVILEITGHTLLSSFPETLDSHINLFNLTYLLRSENFNKLQCAAMSDSIRSAASHRLH